MTNAHYIQYSDHIRMGRCTARGERGCTGGPRAAAGGAHCTERHTLPWLQRCNNCTSTQSAGIVQGCNILRADHRQAKVYIGDADADVYGLPVGRRVQTRIQQDRILLLEPLALFLHRRAPKSGTRWSHGHERDSNYSVVHIRHRKTHLTKVIEI